VAGAPLLERVYAWDDFLERAKEARQMLLPEGKREFRFRCDLFDDPFTPAFRLSEVADYLRTKLPTVQIFTHGELVAEKLSKAQGDEREVLLQRLAIGFAKARVHDPFKPVEEREPLYGEIAYERRRLTTRGEARGVVYDGFMVQELLASLFDREELNRWSLPLVFTNQLLATFDESDRRYHLRTVILGYPRHSLHNGLGGSTRQTARVLPRSRTISRDGLRCDFAGSRFRIARPMFTAQR